MLKLLHSLYGIDCHALISGKNPESLHSPIKQAYNEETERTLLSHSLSGNPLEIEEIVNLSLESKLITDPNKRQMTTSQLLDLSNLTPVDKIPYNEFEDGIIYYVSKEKQQLFGVFPSAKFARRILRINIVTAPDLSLSIDSVKQKQTLLFPNSHCEYKSEYRFKDAIFRANFDRTDPSLLSPPLAFTVGSLTTQLNLYKCDCIPSILDDIKLLKEIFDAYENEKSTWCCAFTPETDLDRFRSKLSSVFQVKRKEHKNESISPAFTLSVLRSALSSRQLDSTECIWDAVKRTDSKKTLKSFVSSAVAYLLEHRDLMKLDRSNDTQLANRLRAITNRPGSIDIEGASSFPFGVEGLLEIGLYKLTNDCLCMLETAIPDVTSLVTQLGLCWDVEGRWAQFHQLYKASCFLISWSSCCSKEAFLPELRKMLTSACPKNEWRTVLSTDPSLQCQYEFPLAVSDLVVPITSISPSLWIMCIDADEPLRARFRLVYEKISDEGADKYVCYEMRLVDTYWPANA